MLRTPKPRDLRDRPLTGRERDTNYYACKFRLLGQALDRFSERLDQTMLDRSIAASRADVYLHIATLFDDLTLIDKAGCLGVLPAVVRVPLLPSRHGRSAD